MTFADWALPYLLVPAVLVPALPPQPKEGWTGEIVFVRKVSTPYTRKVPLENTDPNAVRPVLRGIDYHVIHDKDGKLLISEQGVEVFVAKEDMILLSDAVAWYTQEIEKMPTDSRAFAYRAWAHYRRGKSDDAIKDYSEAIRLAPTMPAWRNNRGIIFNSRKEFDRAVADFDEAIRINPRDGLAYRNRAFAYSHKKDYGKATADYERCIELQPGVAGSYNGLAWLLATCPDAKFRDGKKAVELAKKACELSGHKVGTYLDTLAAALAEVGDFGEAVKWQQKALDTGDFPKNELAEAKLRLQMFKDKKPYRLDEK